MRATCGVWSEAYETARGSGSGYPDLQLLLDSVLVPVELKCGVIRDIRLVPTRIRPAQISWHHEFKAAGGKAFVVVCTGEINVMSAWAIPSTDREVTSRWKEGYNILKCKQWMSSGAWVVDFSALRAEIIGNQ
jgi:hypothetical protein